MTQRTSDIEFRLPPMDPAFDGHLEKPVTAMSPSERLDWAWQMFLLWQWASRAKVVVEDRTMLLRRAAPSREE